MANNSVVHWQALLSHPFLTLSRPSSIRYLIVTKLAQAGLELQVDIEANQLLIIVNLVEQGLEVSVMPNVFAQHMRTPKVVY